MKQIALLVLLSFGAGVMAGKYHPIHTGEVEIAEGITGKQVKIAVKKALVNRGWEVVDASKKGEIKAKISIRKHTADIHISYSAKAVTITYVDSTNLGYKDKKKGRVIHRNYNGWIRNLERDIRVYLVELEE